MAPTSETDGPAARLGRSWSRLRRGPADGDGSGGRRGGVDPVQLDVLDQLAARDGQRMSELAAAVHVDPSTITRAMHRLEATGLATRRPLAGDGRVITAHLTEEGRRAHRRITGRRARVIAAAMADFTPDEQEHLADLLERLVVSLDGAAAGGPQPTAAG